MTTTTPTERAESTRPAAGSPFGPAAASARGAETGGAPGAPALCAAPALLRLFQLSSSLCPIGAFAYSQGLETAVERGWVTTEQALGEWLMGLGEHALARLDLPLLLRAHEAAERGDQERLVRIAERVLASREARELMEQERQLGSSLASVLVTLGVARAAAFRAHPAASHVVSFALGTAHFGVSAGHACVGYGFAWCEQQVSAAARLIPLGHMAAQRVLSAALDAVPAWVEAALALPEHEIGTSTPGLGLSAAWHETQYSRLFRS